MPLGTSGYRYFPIRGLFGSPSTFARLPYCARIFAENLARHGRPAAEFACLGEGRHDLEFAFHPARVLLQDLTGTPALVDLAGLRDAVAAAGGDPRRVNPAVPVDFVVDHSLKVVVDGSHPGALAANRRLEEGQNAERFAFLAWCGAAFDNLRVLPRGGGILHQINLERLSPLVGLAGDIAYPDSLVGTDSHTPMINALGVLGWGVGGIEAESVMLGRPVVAPLPEIVAVRLSGRVPEGIMATDLALALTQYLRREGVVGALLEFRGEGLGRLSLPDRATVANMAPEYGATAAIFPIDGRSLDYLRATGRSRSRIALVEAYAEAQGLREKDLGEARYDRELAFDLGSVRPSIAGPANPHDRIALGDLAKAPIARSKGSVPPGSALLPGDGAVVIAAITSCTNTANPRSLVAAGLLARKARGRGLDRKPWVKTSLAPGSLSARAWLEDAGLLGPLGELGFGIVGYACSTCNGMSGGLPEPIAAEIGERGLRVSAVLSGNRNFNGRIHPLVAESFLASPALVVAWALAGTMDVDPGVDPLCEDPEGRPVFLRELWPSEEEIESALAAALRGAGGAEEGPGRGGGPEAEGGAAADSGSSVPARFGWDEGSTYIRRPPYWEDSFARRAGFRDLRPLAILGDNVTTDDLSPSGAILPESAAGRWLLSRGVAEEDFNSYGTRRGDHLVALRATLANNRLRNEMAGGREGSLARLEPEGRLMGLFEAAEAYLARGQELLIIAGRNYGAGSSRDWAAKGVRLLGVRAVIAESFERIHRSNLIGMGVLPLEFPPGVTRKSLGLDGSETYSLLEPELALRPGAELEARILRPGRGELRLRLRSRIDSPEEARVFAAGGLLGLVRDEILAGAGPQ